LGRIPEATIREIRDRTDIVGLIGRYVELKPAGRNHKGLCPFHDEKSPSFNVSPDRGIFHCFGCQAGGDVLGFLMKHENLTFPEAARQLAAEAGVEIPETTGDRETASRTEKVFEALKLAQDCYRKALAGPRGEPGRRYFEDRGIDSETVEAFGLGYVPDAWDTVERALKQARIPGEIGAEAGLLLERKGGGGHYDRLRGRVTFPVRDVRGRVIAFGGRAISKDQEPKYLNTSESPVFQKRRSFYGMPAALEHIRRAQRAIVCEGYFDAIALSRAELGEALATCGTALTPDHGKELSRRTNNVSLLFDGDTAGQNAMEKALMVLLPEGLRVRAVTLPAGQDPDDYLKEHGAEALRAIVDAAPAALDVVIQRTMRSGCATPDQKADVVRHVGALVALIANTVERAEWGRRLAVATGVDVAAVESTVRSMRQGRSTESDDALRKSVVRPRRSSTEDRKLQQVVMMAARCPGEFSEALRARLPEVLPESVQRDLVLELLAASDEGLRDGSGGVDVHALVDRLSEEQDRMLREALVDETLLDGEQDRAKIVGDLVGDFARRQSTAQETELRRRMSEPDADPVALLRERDEMLRRKREQLHPSARAQTQA
jgi:DNA primase